MRRFFQWNFMGSSGDSQGTSASSTTASNPPTSTTGANEQDPQLPDEFSQLPFQEWNPDFASDPTEWERNFEAEWEVLRKQLHKPCRDVKTVSLTSSVCFFAFRSKISSDFD